jgi:hypothetical protein
VAVDLELDDGAAPEIDGDSGGVSRENHSRPAVDRGLRSARDKSSRQKDSSDEGHL